LCNVPISREVEVVLVFGINKAWERNAGEVHVQLTDRVILSPFAAKRLMMLLNNVIQQYEAVSARWISASPISERAGRSDGMRVTS